MRSVGACLFLFTLGIALPEASQSQELVSGLPGHPNQWLGFRSQEQVATPGSRVRVEIEERVNGRLEKQRYLGTLMRVGADDVLMEAEAQEGTLSLPFTSITRFSVHRGTKGSGFLGAVIGFAGTFFVGQFLPEEKATPGGAGLEGLVLLTVGTGVGAIVGSQVKRDRWETIPVDRLRGGG